MVVDLTRTGDMSEGKTGLAVARGKCWPLSLKDGEPGLDCLKCLEYFECFECLEFSDDLEAERE